ncbi:MAG: sctD [Parachlamydiales bacterium]|nr:sctD [Parachlamydiales bacterium]
MPAHLIAIEGPLLGQVFNFDEGDEWIVGRDPDEADFVIEDGQVSRKHARITRTPDGVFIQNLSRPNPTLINNAPIKDKTLLKEGDQVKIGDHLFSFSLKAAPKEGKLPKRGKKKKKAKGGYEDIFGDIEAPNIPPEPEPIIDAAIEKTEEPPVPEAEKEIAPSAYDTIFEDAGHEAEMPFNLLAETPLVLKVVGGPNAGAEIGLEKGRSYTIGKDPNASDIVFQDLSVSRHHAKLTITQDGLLELEDLGSKNGTMVNNTPITEKCAITSQDTVSMGTTIFMILDREAAQETIYAPKMPLFEESKPPEVPALAVEEAPKPKDWKSQKIPGKHLIFAASFLVMFFIMFLSFFSLFKADPLELAVKAPHEHIKDALAKFPGVQYSFNPASGKLFLAGHILTSVDYQEMKYNLGLLESVTSTDDNVVIDEFVWKSMTDVLTANAGWRGVNITSPEAGKFLIHGYVQSTDQAALLADYLNVNFPYPSRLANQIVVEDTLNIRIQSLLQSKGFGGVAFQLTVGDLMLLGRYNEKQENEYKELLSELSKVEGVQSVKNFAVASLPSQASIDLTQQYKVTGSSMHENIGYSAIINGRMFTIGDALDGMKISAIEPNLILLEKDGLKYKIDYTR